ncbi:hypothetical protein [Streptomyces sp. NBC_01451]|uniref:hypothetical protein n=1 Tax=Streptomyces sp. NBC_01451 TaxID=2903872 RepID=UPI002E377A7B|nr:hypothetical protein [Streptomyces sp. NBC_01451]
MTILSHGVGYPERLATPNTHHPTVGGGSAEAGGPVFGMSPEWLLDEHGVPVADALVLSHPEQYERLRAACPEAAPTAVLAGDPCWDRMLAAGPYRDRFRRALGIRAGQRLALLNSTWNPESLFGDGGDVLPSLLPRPASEFPADEYRFAAVLHPDSRHGHGPGQIRARLDRARRAGLAPIDPLHGWRQAPIAADAVIGDHGSVTCYAAALGAPVLLGAAPLGGLAPEAPVHDFVRDAPRLDPASPLRPQVEAVARDHRSRPEPAGFISSVPGESATRLRQLFYDVPGIPQPDGPALLETLPLPPYEPPSRTVPLLVFTRLPGACEVDITRYAGPRPPADSTGEMHTAVHEDTRETHRLALADVVFRYGERDDARFGTPELWTTEALALYPQCAPAAYVSGSAGCTVGTRDGELLWVRAEFGSDADPAVYASALHAWLAAGKSLDEPVARGLTVRTGEAAHRATVTRR